MCSNETITFYRVCKRKMSKNRKPKGLYILSRQLFRMGQYNGRPKMPIIVLNLKTMIDNYIAFERGL